MEKVTIIWIVTVLLLAFPLHAVAWEEQKVLDYVMAYNPIIKAHRDVTVLYTPPSPMQRVLENTSLFTKLSAGGTDFREEPFTAQAGIQINIPLASPKEQREWAVQAMSLVQQIEEVRKQVLADIAILRQHEADLAASQSRLTFYQDKSHWAQERVNQGYDDAATLWEIAQRLNEERAAHQRLEILVSAQRHQLASHAGEKWETLLVYLKGEGELLEDQ